MTDSPVLRVALAVPLRALFDYLPPENIDISTLEIGMRLRVPFGRGERIAVLVKIVDESAVDPKLLKPVKEVLDLHSFIPEANIDFLSWVAAYYQHPAGEVIHAAIPTRLRKGDALVRRLETAWQLTPLGESTTINDLKRSPKQWELLEYIQLQKKLIRQVQLKATFGVTYRAHLKSLLKKELVETVELPVEPETLDNPEKGPLLNDQQREAVEQVLSVDHFVVSLLHGITGSGKTEVYLSITNAILAKGKQVLVLVPEIALTPQLLDRFRKRVAAPMVTLHSGLSEIQRAENWQQANSGQARIIIGTRSSIFTPLPELGMIIVDEEHELSYKQQEGFRYSARDMAVALAKRNDCPILLGSATPSFESLKNAEKGHYNLLKLDQRAGNAVLPSMDLIDIRSVHLDSGISPVTKRFIKEELDKGHQVLIFINRRGFAPVMICHDCGWVGDCKRCDARMTVHAAKNRLWCHHCGSQQAIPRQCPECESEALVNVGQGTEQIESTLKEYFPDKECVRIDYDTTRRKGSMDEILEAVHANKYQILIGTQMLAKGHDFPNVTLAVLLDIDQGLFGSDFRASERMAQQIMQVSGRAGRAEKPGRVLIQTRHPDHPLLHVLIRQGYEAFSHQALLERAEAEFPPFSFQVLIRAEAKKAYLPENFLYDAVEAGKKLNAQAIEFWGPVAASMQRKAGHHRFHLLLQSSSRQNLHVFLDQWLPLVDKTPMAKKVRWSVDVDPQDFYS